MNDEVRAAIAAVIQYNWADERRDYEVAELEGNERSGHVFEHLVTLDNFLNGTSYAPTDHVEDLSEYTR